MEDLVIDFAGLETASGAGVELREGGAVRSLGRGVRVGGAEGAFCKEDSVRVAEEAGLVPTRGRGFEGARVREAGVR